MRISDWSSDVCSSDLHGGSAVYGGGAAGGVIHINTLKAKEGSPTFETTVAGSSSLTQIDTDGLSGRLDQKVSGTSGPVDYLLSLSGQQTQGFFDAEGDRIRSEEHTSELQSLMRISYAVFCLKTHNNHSTHK